MFAWPNPTEHTLSQYSGISIWIWYTCDPGMTREFELMVLMHPFQLEIFYGIMGKIHSCAV